MDSTSDSIAAPSALRCSTASVQLRKLDCMGKRFSVWINGQFIQGVWAKRIPGKGWSWWEGFEKRGSGLSQHNLKADLMWKLKGQ